MSCVIKCGHCGAFYSTEEFHSCKGSLDIAYKNLEKHYSPPEIPATEELVKPQRYNKGKIEVWDFILDQGLGFLAGNIVKYLCRSDMKGGLADLKKARIYLDKLIAEEEKK